MFKKYLAFLLIMFLIVPFTSCVSDGPQNESNGNDSSDISSFSEVEDTSSEIVQGEPKPTYTVDWPSEMLPDDFPDLGKVTKVYDSRSFSKKITINWNMVNEDQVNEFVDKLNAYHDLEHVWQGNFYSDGVKYEIGTEDEYIRVVIRYMSSATGEIEPDFNPQFFLEITGPGIPDKK